MQAPASALRKVRVDRYMSCPPLTVVASENLEKAFRFMRRNRFSQLPVVGPRGEPLGLVTERSFRRMLAGTAESTIRSLLQNKSPSLPEREEQRIEAVLGAHAVSEVMEPITARVGPADSVEMALALMEAHGVTFLPVVESGAVVGVLEGEDLVWLLEATHSGACLFG
jgi:CBS domain-containing protein